MAALCGFRLIGRFGEWADPRTPGLPGVALSRAVSGGGAFLAYCPTSTARSRPSTRPALVPFEYADLVSPRGGLPLIPYAEQEPGAPTLVATKIRLMRLGK